MKAKIWVIGILMSLFLFGKTGTGNAFFAVPVPGFSVTFAADEQKDAPADGQKAAPAEEKKGGQKGKFKTWEEMTPEEREKIKKEGEGFRDNMVKMFNERLKHRYVPTVESAAVSPAAPAVGKAAKMEVKVGRHADAVDEVKGVEVFHTAPGGEYFDFTVQLKPGAAGGAWAGALPAFKKAGTVQYYIRIYDAFGNVYSDLPCAVSAWPPFDDPCMVSVAADPEPVDDEKINVEDDYDVWEIRAGADDANWYLQQNVEGKIFKGKISPMKVSMYMAAMMKTEKLEEIGDISVFMGEGEKADEARKNQEGASVWLGYTPIGPAVHPDAPACWMGLARMNEGKPDTENIECMKDGSDLFFKIKKKILGDMLQDKVSVIGAITGFVDSIEIPFPKFKDVAGFSRIEWHKRSFEVK